MALQGTIKDFALPDIFQLIGLQKKTGILTLSNDDDTVTLKFRVGEVVGADSPARTLEDRLGEVLVRTGVITQAQLEEALKAQVTAAAQAEAAVRIAAKSRVAAEDALPPFREEEAIAAYRRNGDGDTAGRTLNHEIFSFFQPLNGSPNGVAGRPRVADDLWLKGVERG